MTERRKEESKKEGNRVTIEALHNDQTPSGERVTFAVTDDISFRGIKILSDTPYPINSLLSIELFLGIIKKKINVTGKVRWIFSLGEETYEMGIEIETANTSGDDKQILIDHVYRD